MTHRRVASSWRCSAIRILSATAVLGGLPGLGLAQSSVGHWVSLGPSGGIVLALAVDPRTPSTVYAGGLATGVFKSVDGGESWAFSGIAGARVSALTLDSSPTSVLYAGTNQGVFRSSDGGATWMQASAGLSSTAVFAIVVDPQTPATVYAATFAGIFKSTDGATSWVSMSGGLGAQPVHALAID
ncbi:MAG TPA: hypothetical protein VFA98_16120, partial [Thermoanaerobaculia bacterium]|nr:hypothetical protein [Thermoanaerobaculia bacterium]